MGKYASECDVLKLGWLPLPERRDFHLSLAAFKGLHFEQWPVHLKLERYIPVRTLISSEEILLTVPLENNTFQASAAKAFNNLPADIRNCSNFYDFKRLSKEHYFSIANERLNNS